MDERLSSGSGGMFRGVGSVGRASWRGRFPGRHELKVRRVRPSLVRLICEGWLPQDPCSSPGSHPKIGRGPACLAGLPIALVRGPVAGDVGGLRGARARPGSRRRAGGGCRSVRGQFRVAASQQNVASSRAHATGTVPVGLPRSPPRCAQRACNRRCARHATCTTRGSWPAWRAASS